MQVAHDFVVQTQKHSIRLHGEKRFYLQFAAQALRQFLCRTIGVLRIADPNIVLQQRLPWRRQKTHLRTKLAGLLGAIVKLRPELFLKEDHQLPCPQTVLGPAEAENIHLKAPSHFFGDALQ